MRRDYTKIPLKAFEKLNAKNSRINCALDAKRAYKREYMKQWRKNNPQKVKENEQRYWERKASSLA